VSAVARASQPITAIARAERTSDFAGNCEARSGDDHAICIALDADRSGEIFYVPKRGWILEELKEPMATSHGTLYDYDRQVPVLTLPFGRTPHAPLTAPAGGPRFSMRDVSKTLATWLGVTPPAQMPR
jgi:hypothetical protein